MAEKKKPAHPSIRLELPLNGRLKGLLRVLAAFLLLPSAGYTVRLAVEPSPPSMARALFPNEGEHKALQSYYEPRGWKVLETYFSNDGRTALIKLESQQ